MFKDRSQLNFGYQDDFIRLENDFNPTYKSDFQLPAGSEYDFGRGFINYQSTRKTMFNWKAEAVKGTFYSGNIQYVQGQAGYRFQPYLNLGMNFNYTDMDLGDPFT